jgi:hypothetical protein
MMGMERIHFSNSQCRHCEERSDEAIQKVTAERSLDCFASLAMTGRDSAISRHVTPLSSLLKRPPPPTPPRHALRGEKKNRRTFAISRRDGPEVCWNFSRLRK